MSKARADSTSGHQHDLKRDFQILFVSSLIQSSDNMPFCSSRWTGRPVPSGRLGPRRAAAGAIHTTRLRRDYPRLMHSGIAPDRTCTRDRVCAPGQQLALSGAEDVERLCTGPGRTAVLAQIEQADNFGALAGLDVGDEARGGRQDEVDAEAGPTRLAL